jgi:hypothetical protein
MDMAEPSFFTCIVAKCVEKKNLYEVNVEGDSTPPQLRLRLAVGY